MDIIILIIVILLFVILYKDKKNNIKNNSNNKLVPRTNNSRTIELDKKKKLMKELNGKEIKLKDKKNRIIDNEEKKLDSTLKKGDDVVIIDNDNSKYKLGKVHDRDDVEAQVLINDESLQNTIEKESIRNKLIREKFDYSLKKKKNTSDVSLKKLVKIYNLNVKDKNERELNTRILDFNHKKIKPRDKFDNNIIKDNYLKKASDKIVNKSIKFNNIDDVINYNIENYENKDYSSVNIEKNYSNLHLTRPQIDYNEPLTLDKINNLEGETVKQAYDNLLKQYSYKNNNKDEVLRFNKGYLYENTYYLEYGY